METRAAAQAAASAPAQVPAPANAPASAPAPAPPALPMSDRRTEDVPGHWLLAHLGKRVLRPGGAAMTTRMLADADLVGADVVELAPGLGRTAAEIVAAGPASYVGIEQDEKASRLTAEVVGGHGECRTADATATGLPDASADVVVGEAMLTMQTERGKNAIIAEAKRVLRPGGRYAIHELGLTPDDLDPQIATEIRKALARSIKVNVRPLTAVEWRTLFEDAGFEVEHVRVGVMGLLHVRRNLADEGVLGTLRIGLNYLRDADARRRVNDMWKVFHRHRRSLTAITLVARLPQEA